MHGHRFYIHFVDDHTRYTWLYPLKNKGEAINAFNIFRAHVENQFNKKIKAIRCDNGAEYKPVSQVAQSVGIEMQFSCPYTSAQNGRAERKHRHIVEMGPTLLAQAQLPYTYWTNAFQTAVYLINRLPTPVLNLETPMSLLYKKSPDYKALQPFGCACYPCLKPYNSHKFQYHSEKCVFLGPAPQHRGYKCLSSTGRVYISRHVVFDSSLFPCCHGFLNRNLSSSGGNECVVPINLAKGFSFLRRHNTEHGSGSLVQSLDEEGEKRAVETTASPEAIHVSPRVSSQSHASREFLSDSDSRESFSEPREQSTRINEAESSAQGESLSSAYVDPTSPNNSIGPSLINELTGPTQGNAHVMVTRAKAGIHKPKHPFVCLIHYPELGHLSQTSEPSSVSHALSIPHWRIAMEEEFKALQHNRTWELVPYNNTQKLIDWKWVFKTKFQQDGSLLKHKARLVAKGFQQAPRLDYRETFSPVVKPTTIRVVLAIAVTSRWEIRELDVNMRS